MPSFFEMRYIRRLKDKGEYFFLDTQIISLDEEKEGPVLGIAGRIVKNTRLKRDQIYRTNGGLIEDRSELETAPSSTFLLILNSHRLILCPEVPGGPTISNFQSTSQYCLTKSYHDYLGKSLKKNKKDREINPAVARITKKALREEFPNPKLRITPLSDKESLKAFVGRFSQIDKVAIKLLPTNGEDINNDDFWADLGRRKNNMGSNYARVEFSNTKDGLESNEVLAQTTSASNMGNSEVKFKGYDEEGSTIKGSNDEFSLSVDLDELPKNAQLAAIEKYRQFKHLVSAGVIALPQIAVETVDKVREILDRQ